MTNPDSTAARSTQTPQQRRHARRMICLLLAICVAPIVASYFFYYVARPAGGTTAYGRLVEPQRPIPPGLTVADMQGHTQALASLKGKWLMISVDAAACGKPCVEKLYYMRQVRALQGNERARVENVWLLTDDAPVSPSLREAYADTEMWRADPAALQAWLPSSDGTRITDHIYLVDPLGNLMMAFPKDPEPTKIKSDLSRLLRWSGTG